MVADSPVALRVSILQNVSPSTWYAHFRWLRREAPSKDELKNAMIKDA